MRGVSLYDVLRCLRQASACPADGGLADVDLLRRWADQRDQAAFEVLLWRYGPMVLGVCRRWLSGPDADDAFQAAFLTLALQAGRIRRGERLGGWLHRVAVRVCMHARSAARPAPLTWEVAAEGDPMKEVLAGELRAVLDEEVNRLPERFRAPFVLCYLQGQTNAEAARALGRPLGTILSQLAAARQRLRVRLRRRGLAPAALAGLLVPAAASQAAVGAALAAATVQTAPLFVSGGAAVCAAPVVALTNGVLKAMFAAKIKTAAAVVLSVALLGTGGGFCGYRAFAPGGAHAEEQEGAPAVKPGDAALHKQLQALRAELAVMRQQLDRQEKTIQQQADQLRLARGAGVARRAWTSSALPAAKAILEKDPRGGTIARPAAEATPGDASRDPLSSKGAGDSIELLAAQVKVKAAHLEAAKLEVNYAKARLARLMMLHKQGAVTLQLVEEAQAAADSAGAKVRIREAELKESAVALQQAEAHLKKNPPAAKTEDRLRELEKKLTDLLQEVRALRGNKTPAANKPATP